MAIQFQRPRGTADITPPDIYKWHYVEELIRETSREFGFSEIRFPTFEKTGLFVRSVGDTTDIVQKEMYTFKTVNKNGEEKSYSLRPEGTASVVRAFIENSMFGGGLPVKLYYIAPNFRHERPQAGRLCEHHQFGVEYFGSYDPSSEAEVMAIEHTLLSRLGIRDIELHINSVGCEKCRPEFQSSLRGHFSMMCEQLCPTCNDRLDKNPMRILDCKNSRCSELARNAPDTISSLCDECAAHLETVESHLDALEIPYRRDPGIVRGLDYYTRTVFEFVTTSGDRAGTVCGGGRYDGLVASLGGPPTAGLGFGCGIERLLGVMESQNIEIPKPPGCLVFIGFVGARGESESLKLTHALRKMNISAERDSCARGIKAQLKYADRLGARFAIVLGDDELDRGTVNIKDMLNRNETGCELNAEKIAVSLEELT